MTTEALIAHVLVAKYADHLPLYRQAQIYGRRGVTLDPPWRTGWPCRLVDDVASRSPSRRPEAQPRLFADETTVLVLELGRGRAKTGQLWTHARDD